MESIHDDVPELLDYARSLGASDAGIAPVADGPGGLPYAVAIAVRLSEAIIGEISCESGPTYTYFNHYRSVNSLIDRILLQTGLWLQARGARYITVAASQSRPDSPYEGRYSHKKAACLAGLGEMGKNALFLHRTWGPRVRLGTLFTDWEACGSPGSEPAAIPRVAPRGPDAAVVRRPQCAECGLCVEACPAKAISADGFNAERCSLWMKKEYQHIGRGSVCGICIRVCPR